MGLGPPVCTKCERIQDLLTKDERDRLIAAGKLKPLAGWWWCSKCGGNSWYEPGEGTKHNPHCAKCLWELPVEDQKKYGKNSGR